MSSAEYAALVRELESLRAGHRSELAQRLHDAKRIYDPPSHGDGYHIGGIWPRARRAVVDQRARELPLDGIV
jgi:hypothetical protein